MSTPDETIAACLFAAKSSGCTCEPFVDTSPDPRFPKLSHVSLTHDDKCPLLARRQAWTN